MESLLPTIRNRYEKLAPFTLCVEKSNALVTIVEKEQGERRSDLLPATQRAFHALAQRWPCQENPLSSLKKGELVFFSQAVDDQYIAMRNQNRRRLEKRHAFVRLLLRIQEKMARFFHFRPDWDRDYRLLHKRIQREMEARISKALGNDEAGLLGSHEELVKYLRAHKKRILSLLIATGKIGRRGYGEQKDTLTHLAVRNEDKDFIRCEKRVVLLENDAQQSPLLVAFREEKYAMVEEMLRRGVILGEREKSFLLAPSEPGSPRPLDAWLLKAVECDYPYFIDYVCKKSPAWFKEQESLVPRLLEEACRHGSVEVLRTLLLNSSISEIKTFSFADKPRYILVDEAGSCLHALCRSLGKKERREERDFHLLLSIAKHQAFLAENEKPLAASEALPYLESDPFDYTLLIDKEGNQALTYFSANYRDLWKEFWTLS